MVALDFPRDLLYFPDIDAVNIPPGELATIHVAAALSKLSYADDPVNEFAKNAPQYQNLRDSALLANIWAVRPALSSNDERSMLFGWSQSLNTIFIAFRGSVNVDDWLTDVDVQAVLDDSEGWALHNGFSTRADKLPIDLFWTIVQRHRTVLCGHSLGGALATVAGLRLMKTLGNTARNVWDPCEDRTTYLSIVTFGSPTAIYRPDPSAPGLRKAWRQLFHNVIDPEDLVPSAYNLARSVLQKHFSASGGEFRTLGRKLVSEGVRLTLDAVGVGDQPWKLLISILGLCSPNSVTGAHIGTIILLESAQSFRLVTEDYYPTMYKLLQASKGHSSIDSICHSHCMQSYLFKWRTFSWNAAQGTPPSELAPPFDLPASLVPDVTCSAVSARQTDTGVDFTVVFDSIIAQQTFDVAIIQTAGMSHNLELNMQFSTDKSTELSFHFRIGLAATVDEWMSVLSASQNSLVLVDIFGRHLPLTLPNGVDCPTLSHLNRGPTTALVKRAMLHALVAQISWSSTLSKGCVIGELCPEAREIARAIDDMVCSAAPELVAGNLRRAFQEVDRHWVQLDQPPPRVEPAMVKTLSDFRKTCIAHPRGTQRETREYSYQNLLPQNATGATRDLLDSVLKCMSESVNAAVGGALGCAGDIARETSLRKAPTVVHTHGTDPKDVFLTDGAWQHAWARQSDDARRLDGIMCPPSFSDALLRYSQHARTNALSSDTSSTAGLEANEVMNMDRLRSAMIVCHTIVNSQLMVPYGWMLRPPKQLKRIFLNAGFMLLACAGIPVLLLAATIKGNKLVALKALQEIGVADGRYDERSYEVLLRIWFHSMDQQFPLTIQAAEQALLKRYRNQGLDFIRNAIKDHWDSGFPVTDFYANWIHLATQFGRMRELSANATCIGTLGMSRKGKSSLLTQTFGLDKSILTPGGANENRTLDIHSHRLGKHCLLLDFPGTDEGGDIARNTATFAFDLLDIYIVVLDYAEVHTNHTSALLENLATRLQSLPRIPPFRILLNRADHAIEKKTSGDPDYWAKDIHKRKCCIVNAFSQFLGRTTVETLVAHARPDSKEGKFIRPITEDLVSVVHPCCLIMDDDDDISPFKLKILKHLREQGLLWDAASVRQWVDSICPEAVET